MPSLKTHSFLRLIVALFASTLLLPAQTTVTFTDAQVRATAINTSAPNSPTTLALATGAATQSGVISGTGSVTVSGAGTLTLSGTNTYTGGTQLSAGTLVVANAASLGTGALTFTAGTLRNSTDVILANNITLAGTSGTFDASAGYFTLNGTVSGSGALNKTGTNLLTLDGTQTYTGATTISAGQLKFNGSTATSSIVLNGATTTVYFTSSQTYAGDITGTGILDREFSGTTILTGNATHTGGTIIDTGTIQIGNGGTTGSLTGNVTLANGGTLAFNRSDATSLAGVVSGTGSLIKSGAGTLTLSGANTYTGGTTVNAGTLQLGNSGSTLADAGAVTVNGGLFRLSAANETIGSLAGSGGTIDLFNLTGRALTVTQTADATFAGVIQGTGGALTKTGTGTLTLTGNNTYTGGTTISAGTLQIGNGGTSGEVFNFINNGAALVFNRSDNFEFSGMIFGAGSVTQAGPGTLTLTGSSVYAGATTVSAGALALGASDRLPDGSAVTVAAGATFNLAGFSDTIGSLAGAGNVTLGAGTLTIGGNATSTAFSGVLSGTGSLAKIGAGTLTLTLTGANTYTGGTTISAGTLVGNTTSLQGNIVNNSATLIFDQASTGTYGGVVSGSGPLTKTGAGTLTLSGANTYSGGTTVSNGTLVGNTTSLQGNIANNAALTFDQASAGTYGGVVSGTGSVTKTGSGTLTLSGANTYTGATTISTGTLTLGAANRLADTSALSVASGATFNLANFADTVGSLAGAGNVTLGSGSLTAGGNNTSTTFSGVLSGTGGFSKTGNGTLTLSGANTYTGATTVSAGTLTLGSADRIANASALSVAAGATFNLANFSESVGSLAGAGNVTFGSGSLTAGGNNTSTTFSGVLSGTGGLAKTGTGTLTLSGANTYTGATTVSAGTLTLGANNALAATTALTLVTGTTFNLANFSTAIGSVEGTSNIAGGITLGSGTLSVGANHASTSYNGIIAGTGGLTKTGTGTLTLAGANTYTGATTVTAGTLNISHTTASTAMSVAAGATLSFNTFSAQTYTLSTLEGAGTVSGASAQVIVGGGNESFTFAGTLAAALTKSGSGTLTFTGTGTNTSSVTVNAGTLDLSSGGLLSSLTANSGATVALGTTAQTLRKLVLNQGTLTGSAALTIQDLDLQSGTFALDTTRSVSGDVLIGAGGTLALGSSNQTFNNLTLSAGTANAPAQLTGTGAVTISSNLEVNDFAVLTPDLIAPNGVSVGYNFTTPNQLVLGGNLTGNISLAEGASLQIGDGGTRGAVSGTITASNASVAYNRSDSVTIFAPALIGLSTLAQRGSGTLTLLGDPIAATPSYSLNNGYDYFRANIEIASGIFALGTTSPFDPLDYYLNSQRTLNMSGGTYDLGGHSTALRSVGTATAGNVGDIRNGILAVRNDLYLQSGTIGANLTGSAKLTKVGAGTLTLTGNNSYQGGTQVDAGTLRFTDASTGSSASGSITLAATTSLVLDRTQDLTLGNSISGAGSITKSGTGKVVLNADLTYTGGTTITGGNLQLGGTVAGNIVNAATLTFDPSGDLTYGGVISGTGNVSKTGNGTLTLAGLNTYAGGTTVAGGLLKFTAFNAFGSGAITLDGGGLQWAPGTTTDLTASAQFNRSLGTGGGTFDTNDNNITFAQALSGSGSLTKAGNGTLSFTTANSYAGGTFITGGTLRILDGGSITGDIDNQAALVFSRSTATTFTGSIGGFGTLAQNGSGTLTLTADHGYASDTTVNAGTLIVNGSVVSAVTVNFGATLGGSGIFYNNTTLASGAHLAPGNSPGTLTFAGGLTLAGGSILDFQLGTTSDLIRVSGGTLSGPLTGLVTVNLSNSGGFTAGTYTIFDFTSAATSSFDTTDFTFGTTIPGYTYALAFSGSTLALTATASAIPEPSTYAALAGALALGLALYRRRKTSATRSSVTSPLTPR